MSETIDLERSLHEVGDEIYDGSVAPATEGLASATEDWIELHGLDRLDDPGHVLARQAAFNLFLKATLYDSYRATGADLPPLSRHDVWESFCRAHELTGDSAFRRYVLDDVAEEADMDSSATDELLDATAELRDSERPAEDIGRVFERLTPQETRRKLGQFRTPPSVAELMTRWCVRDGRDRVLDPGMGAGILSAAAYRRKRHLDSKATLSENIGIDRNELALVMSATALRLSDRGTPHNLRVGDYLRLDPEETGTVDAVVVNPPYSRHHELDSDVKTEANQRASDEAGMGLSSLSSLYTYFYVHSAQFLSDGDRMSFITPAEFLETKYGVDLKRFLLDDFHVRALVMTGREASIFDEAMTTTCISFLERREGEKPGTTTFVHARTWPGVEPIFQAIEGNEQGETDWGHVNTVRQETLVPDEKWTLLFDPLDIEAVSGLTPLGAIANVQRGIATGNNDFFCLSQNEVDERGIEDDYLAPLIRSASRLEHFDYTEEDWNAQRDEGGEVWLLYHLDVWKPLLRGTAVARYLEYGKEIGADDSYLARNRPSWCVVDRRSPPDVLFKYMSRNGGRFVYNRAGVRNLNNIHGLCLDREYTDQDAKALLAYLNSRRGDRIVRRAGREYMGGLSKLEPNELKGIPVIDPQQLDRSERQALVRLFDDLCETSRQGREQKVLDELDDRIGDVLSL